MTTLSRQTLAGVKPAQHIMSLDSEVVAATTVERGETLRIVEGTASTQARDRYQTRISVVALERAIPNYLKNPVYCYNHNWEMPIGIVTLAERRGDNIFTRAELMGADAGDELTDKVWSRIERGIVKSQSIGWNGSWEKDGGFDRKGQFWWGKPDGSGNLDWVDTSAVTIPGNCEADDLRVARSLSLDVSQPWLTMKQCRGWGDMTDSEVRSGIEKALKGDTPVSASEDNDPELMGGGPVAMDNDWWVQELYEDHAIVRNYKTNKTFSVPYTVADRKVSLGEMTEVKQTWTEVRGMGYLEGINPEEITPENADLIWRKVASAACRMANAAAADTAQEKIILRECYKRLDKTFPYSLNSENTTLRSVDWSEDEPQIFEENIFLASLRKIAGLVEGNRNIVKAWAKAERVLSPTYAAEVASVETHVHDIVEEIRKLQEPENPAGAQSGTSLRDALLRNAAQKKPTLKELLLKGSQGV